MRFAHDRTCAGDSMSRGVLRPTSRSGGLLRHAGRELRCVFGAAGLRLHKQEGDDATPCGLLPLRRVLYRADRLPAPATALPREPIAPDDGWCDDVGDADYNRAVRLPHPARHERMWREDRLYDVVAMLGHNDDPVRRGRGSAIFLHLAAADERPTNGCLALHRDDLLWALASGLSEIELPCP